MAAVISAPISALAQDAPGLRLGPAFVAPSLTISGIGLDSNVYGDADEPKRDVVANIGPRLDGTMRLSRFQVSGSTGLSYRYFRTYADQRGMNTSNQLRADVPGSRVSPYFSTTFDRAFDREGISIYLRTHHVDYRVRAGATVRLNGRVGLEVATDRTGQTFGKTDQLRDLSVREQLDRRLKQWDYGVHYNLTPLTRISVVAAQQRTVFTFSPERNADGLRLTSSVEFRPLALISGTIRVGLLRFNPTDATQPTFNGPVAALDLNYNFRGSTQATFTVNRDLGYSVDNLKTYFLQTIVGGGLSQQLSPHWYVGINGSMQQSGIRRVSRLAMPDVVPGAEKARVLGTTVGYRVSRAVRLGLNGEVSKRAGIPQESYDNVRFYGSATYHRSVVSRSVAAAGSSSLDWG